MSIEAKTPEGYRCEGTHFILAWSYDGDGVSVFVARSSGPGRRWLKFLRKIGKPTEWWVTAHPTKGEACERYR